jgi:uncharacterized protein (TIGR02996 family)
MIEGLLEGESDWLTRIVSNLADDELKLVYADWLEDREDERAQFLRAFVAASRTMKRKAFPSADDLPEEWLELIGFRLLQRIAVEKTPALKGPVLRFARPALRLKQSDAGEPTLGASKIGGLPDLPPGFRWPIGDDCRATYNDSTTGVRDLAGFVAQINFAEIAHTQAMHGLPATGLLSFWCFQDMEHDCPDIVGVKVAYFPDATRLRRTESPAQLIGGNEVMPVVRLTFEETLDLPEPRGALWYQDLIPDPEVEYEVLEELRTRNFRNFLGYGRSTSGGDPTPSRDWRHLIVLNNAPGCQLHIQLHQDDLAALNFDAIALVWVDFD